MTYQGKILSEIADLKWPEEGASRIPSWVYTSEEIFRRELEVFHYGKSWNYVGLECELPEAGSFKRTWIGPRSVIVTRDENGEIHTVENRCAHRDSQLTWKECGQFADGLMVCPYHNWSYDMSGSLKSMPFFRGANGNPGMPADFDRSKHGLTKLHTTVRGGAIWATYREDAPSFADFLGEGLPWYDRLFSGEKTEIARFLPADCAVQLEILLGQYA